VSIVVTPPLTAALALGDRIVGQRRVDAHVRVRVHRRREAEAIVGVIDLECLVAAISGAMRAKRPSLMPR
jgi:hypothetical protein